MHHEKIKGKEYIHFKKNVKKTDNNDDQHHVMTHVYITFDQVS